MTRILVVDDSATMRRIIRSTLNALGYQAVEEAAGGVAALTRIAAGGIDLLISDWAMPEMSGLELLRAVRADAAHAGLPVLMVTGIGEEADIAEAVTAGVAGYLIKPFQPETLAAKVQQILGGAGVKA
ncbi:MAG TPA: response regulator [Methylomirabilota bacterium]|nr:response regulator [Methylomirabilota bacterium]